MFSFLYQLHSAADKYKKYLIHLVCSGKYWSGTALYSSLVLLAVKHYSEVSFQIQVVLFHALHANVAGFKYFGFIGPTLYTLQAATFTYCNCTYC